MEHLAALAGLAVVHLLAVASPGPSTVVVIQAAAVSGRRVGLLAAFAMMLGALIWAAAALYGLQILFARFEWLYAAFRIGGAIYLLYLAVMMLRHAGSPLPETGSSTVQAGVWRGFLKALLLQLSNPKVMVFMGSIFLALLPAGAPLWVSLAAIAIVLVNELGWYALVALVFSAGPARDVYRRAQRWIDRTMGVVLGGLGLRLMLDRS